MKKFLIIFSIFLFAFGLTLADVKMEFNSYTEGDDSDKGTNTAIMTSNKLKIDNSNVEGNITMIFDANKNKMIVVNHSQKNYMVFTEETLNNIKKQISGMMAQMKEQFANLPEAQRQQMEKMMEAQMGPMTAPTFTLEKTGKTEKINKWNTTKYNLKSDGELNSEIWAASFSELNITKNDFLVMEKFVKFTEKMLESVPKAQKDPFSAVYSEMQGLPVKTISANDKHVTELVSISDYSASESDFEIPSDYNEQNLGMTGR